MIDFKNKIIAVAGASDKKEKWGYKIFKNLKDSGVSVYAVNPNCDRIGKIKCFHRLKHIPEKIDILITVTKPEVTENLVKECKKIGINNIWMQPGSESEKAIDYCLKNSIDFVQGSCFLKSFG